MSFKIQYEKVRSATATCRLSSNDNVSACPEYNDPHNVVLTVTEGRDTAEVILNRADAIKFANAIKAIANSGSSSCDDE